MIFTIWIVRSDFMKFLQGQKIAFDTQSYSDSN